MYDRAIVRQYCKALWVATGYKKSAMYVWLIVCVCPLLIMHNSKRKVDGWMCVCSSL